MYMHNVMLMHRTCMFIYMYICMFTSMHTFTNVYMHKSSSPCPDIHTYIHTERHILYICDHIHINMQNRASIHHTYKLTSGKHATCTRQNEHQQGVLRVVQRGIGLEICVG